MPVPSCSHPFSAALPPPDRYEDADIYWQRLEDKYHFSCQFTADLIAMNHADFIVTSTYQARGGGAAGLYRQVAGSNRPDVCAAAAAAWLYAGLLSSPAPARPRPQEIAGHEEMVGQYESYKSFTMPQLYRVVEVGALPPYHAAAAAAAAAWAARVWCLRYCYYYTC